tara:strand:+ start:232 stop:1122 length:891 start_codon:yes stop_codon:yes gene_type:complete
MKLSKQEREQKKIEEEKNWEKYWFDPEISNTSHKIIIGDNRNLKIIKSNSIHLIVTSPPYFNAKDYSQWPNLKEYLKDMKKSFKQCLRILVPGRKFCLNISDLPEKGDYGVKWNPLGSELLQVAQSLGFELCDRIIWFKTPIKGFQYGSLPYPPSPLICDSMEYIYIFRKPGKNNYTHLNKKQKEASKLKRDEYAEFTKQIWTIPRVRRKDNMDGHIAPFPDELAHRCIKLYSFVGETIFDPFGGSGTTTKMAIQNKRNSILCEIKNEYLTHIKKKIGLDQKELFNNTKIDILHEK